MICRRRGGGKRWLREVALALLVREDVEVGSSGQVEVGWSVRVGAVELALAVRPLQAADLLNERLELALLGLKALALPSLLANQRRKAPF